MKRLLTVLGSASAVLALTGCGAEAGQDVGSTSDSLSGDFGGPALAAAQSGNGFIVELGAGGDGAVDAWEASHAVKGRRFRFVHARVLSGLSPSDVASLSAVPGVVGVYPDRVVNAIAKPGGGGGGVVGEVLPASVTRVGAPSVWASGNTGAGIGIAIVDTGIDPAHPDLAHPSACFTAYTDCTDGHGHGTHVAGTSAALDNETGVIGVAPGAVPYAVRVLSSSGSGTDSAIVSGLEWVLENATTVSPPVRVVNMSLGRAGSVNDNPVMHAAVTNLVNAGVVVVVAAGNDASLEIDQQIPSAYPEVIAVASTTAVNGKGITRGTCAGFTIPKDTASYFTSDGAGVVVSAPGEEAEDIGNGCSIKSVGILSLARGGGTTRMSGTSMASPNVAGVAALLLAADGSLTPSDVAGRLGGTASCSGSAPKASPTGSYSFDGVYEGVANAPAAIANVPGGCL